jgi:hypothetical protein
MGCGCGCDDAKIANIHSLVVNNLALNELLPSAQDGQDAIDAEYGSDGSALQVSDVSEGNRCYAYTAWALELKRNVFVALSYEKAGYSGIALAFAVATAIAIFGFATGGIGLGLALGLGIATIGGIGGTLTTDQKIAILRDYSVANIVCHMLAEMPENTPLQSDLKSALESLPVPNANDQYVKDIFLASVEKTYGHYALLVWLARAKNENQERVCDCVVEEEPYWAVSTPGINIVSDNLSTLVFDIVGAPKGITRRLLPSDELALVVINSISADAYCGVDVYRNGTFFYGGALSGLNTSLPSEGTFSFDFYNDVRVTLEYENFS